MSSWGYRSGTEALFSLGGWLDNAEYIGRIPFPVPLSSPLLAYMRSPPKWTVSTQILVSVSALGGTQTETVVWVEFLSDANFWTSMK